MRILSNTRIATRLSLAFGAVLATMGFMILFSLGQIENTTGSSQRLATASLNTVTLARDAQAAAQAGAVHLHELFMLPAQSQRIPVYTTIDAQARKREAAISALLAAEDAPHYRSQLDGVVYYRDRYVNAFDATVEAVELDVDVARAQMIAHTMPALEDMLAALDALVTAQSERATLKLLGINTLKAESRDAILSLGGVAVLLACLSALAITRSIARPLAQTEKLARDIAAGELGSMLPLAGKDEVGGLIRALDDMRHGIAARETRIADLAFKDSLTGLPNRTLFIDRLRQALEAARSSAHPLSLLVLDIDRFKTVNNVLGHPVGDRLLVQIAERLKSASLRDSDLLARIAGDEFRLLLPTQDVNQAVDVARRLIGALHEPIELDGQAIDVSASVGIASFPAHGDSADVLMSRADLAMYVAKQGGDGFVCFDSMLERSTDQGLSLLSDLRRAVDRNELTLHFQPKMKLPERTCGSVEALVRWRHPTRGMIPPDQFIPFAEETGFIRNITCWVLESACATAAAWARDGRPLGINVNVSTRDLVSMDLPSVVAGVLARQGLNPALLCLEITESAIMGDPTLALASLSRLNEMGVRLSIDDFGTGYSSLAYLKKLPVQELKIDRSFVMNLDRDSGDAMIVRSTIELAHNFGLQVVAEGVENEHICQTLIRLGCDEAQGYHFGRPMPADDFDEWYRGSVTAAGPVQRIARR